MRMCFFRVARNLKMSSDWKRHQGTVLALLKNCLSLLDATKYPQVAIFCNNFSWFFKRQVQCVFFRSPRLLCTIYLTYICQHHSKFQKPKILLKRSKRNGLTNGRNPQQKITSRNFIVS